MKPSRHHLHSLRRLAGALCLAAAGLQAAGVALAAPAVGSDNVEAIRESRRVAIDRFGIEFYTQLYGEGRAGRNTARMTAELEGISDTTRSAITQQAYADTVLALRTAGYEVVDLAELASQPLYAALAQKYGKPSPWTVENEKMLQGGKQVSRIVAPEGMPAYFQSGTARGDLQQRTENQNFAIGQQQGELAKALGATLLDIHVLASFGTVSATQNGALRIFARTGASAAIEPQPVIYPEDTQIQIVNSTGSRTFGVTSRLGHTGAVYLKEPLIGDAGLFAMRDTQPQAEKDGQVAINFLSSMIGGNAMRAGTAVVSASSEAAYRSAYQALIREAIGALVTALGPAR